jgi:hypothetical protein
MSGRKRTYVSVDQSELYNLMEQESTLRTIHNDFPQRLDQIRQEANQEFTERMRPLESRLKQSENMVGELKSELANTEREIYQHLNSQQRDFRNQIEAQRGEYLNLIEAQGQRFGAALQTERQARQRAVNNLQGQINKVVSEAMQKKEIAASFVSDLRSIVFETRKMPHERFAPGRLDSIERHVEDAGRTVQTMPEAALSTAQAAYWDMVDLRDEVLAKEREFTLLYQAALVEAKTILEQARAHRKYAIEFGEGKNLTVLDLEVDHWTKGKLTEFEEKVLSLERKLSSGEYTLSTDDVKEMRHRLDDLKPEIVAIVEMARANILSSQLRCNIAEVAGQALAAQGFAVEDSAYEGEDERNAYVLKVKNIAGSEVVTVIAPVEDEMGKNEVSINSYDATFLDEITLQNRADEIAGSMKDVGLQVGSPEHVGDANPLYRDMHAVRSRKSVQQ